MTNKPKLVAPDWGIVETAGGDEAVLVKPEEISDKTIVIYEIDEAMSEAKGGYPYFRVFFRFYDNLESLKQLGIFWTPKVHGELMEKAEEHGLPMFAYLHKDFSKQKNTWHVKCQPIPEGAL